jgi:hypothetical protein
MNYLPTRKNTLLLSLIVAVCCYATQAYSAYCSLRDPVSAINTLYPNSTHHRSITREVDRESRDHVSKRLPFTLLFNELGKHTLYVVMNEKMPLGFIHARSELSDFGLIEIVWAINPDMTIKDSYFQRCRNKKCRDAAFIADIKSLINNKSFAQLNALVKQESPSPKAFTQDHVGLKQAIIKSALKTIAVTESVWAEDVDDARRHHLAYTQFGMDQELTITAAIDDLRYQKIRKEMTFSMVYPSSIKTYQISSAKEKIGAMVYAKWEQYGHSGAFNWVFDNTGTVLNIQPSQPWQNAEIAQEFSKTLGKNVSNEDQCNTATELTGEKLFRLSQLH